MQKCEIDTVTFCLFYLLLFIDWQTIQNNYKHGADNIRCTVFSPCSFPTREEDCHVFWYIYWEKKKWPWMEQMKWKDRQSIKVPSCCPWNVSIIKHLIKLNQTVKMKRHKSLFLEKKRKKKNHCLDVWTSVIMPVVIIMRVTTGFWKKQNFKYIHWTWSQQTLGNSFMTLCLAQCNFSVSAWKLWADSGYLP